MTQFEQQLQDAKAGKLIVPIVEMDGGVIGYFQYQLASHKYALRIMAAGMKVRQVKMSELKKYYGLQGRSTKEVATDFLAKYDGLMQKTLN